MQQQIRHGGPGREGARLDRVRLNEAITHAVFGGRRRRAYARITALAGARPGDRVLDIGCGGGYLARLLAAAVGPAGRVTGVDPSEAAVRYARRRAAANCTFRVGVAQDLDLPDRSFDVVTSTLAAHHIPEAARAAAFGEMFRVLRPGGRSAPRFVRWRRPRPKSCATRRLGASAGAFACPNCMSGLRSSLGRTSEGGPGGQVAAGRTART